MECTIKALYTFYISIKYPFIGHKVKGYLIDMIFAGFGIFYLELV